MGTTSGHDDEPVTGLEPDEAAIDAVEHVDTQAAAEAMHLLAEGVPLALLADLASPRGPESPEILESEGLPDVAWWEDDSGASGDGGGTDETVQVADARPSQDSAAGDR